MRNCPVCTSGKRELVFSMGYKVPDGWPLPDQIDWHKCRCGMIYGDGNFNQQMLNEYYQKYYGFGVNSQDVVDRLESIALDIFQHYPKDTRVVDFGGSGDDGKSVLIESLKGLGFENVYNVNAGDPVPSCDILLASHVIEHIYDMNKDMGRIIHAISHNGLLIVDGPDATGIAQHWKTPLLDFHTKHVNHFRLVDYLRLMEQWDFELVDSLRYVDVRSNQKANCFRLYFRRFDVAESSRENIKTKTGIMLDKLKQIDYPVNFWGLGDLAWHLLSQVNLDVLNYIDSDPAYVGKTYTGKPVLKRPDNDAPIVIVAQGQRDNLLAYIKSLDIPNKVISI